MQPSFSCMLVALCRQQASQQRQCWVLLMMSCWYCWYYTTVCRICLGRRGDGPTALMQLHFDTSCTMDATLRPISPTVRADQHACKQPEPGGAKTVCTVQRRSIQYTLPSCVDSRKLARYEGKWAEQCRSLRCMYSMTGEHAVIGL